MRPNQAIQPTMKTNRRMLITVLFVFAASSVHAHLLWTTYSECVAVLGQPLSSQTSDLPPATDVYSFAKGDWGMRIHYWDRRAHLIVCKKLTGSLTADEIQATLNGFADGNSWSKNEDGNLWRSDQRIVATIEGNSILIFSAEFFTAAVSRQTYH